MTIEQGERLIRALEGIERLLAEISRKLTQPVYAIPAYPMPQPSAPVPPWAPPLSPTTITWGTTTTRGSSYNGDDMERSPDHG